MSQGLDTSVQYLKGVGPRYAKILEKRGASTIGQLLEWYPRAYEDRRAARSISSLQIGETVSLSAKILKVHSTQLGKGYRRLYTVTVGDSSGRIDCKYFRVPYKGYFERFETGAEVRVVGKVTLYRHRKEFHHPDIRVSTVEDEVDSLIPLYTETEGISPQRIVKIMQAALQKADGLVEDKLPQWVRDKYDLPDRFKSLKAIHQPPDDAGPEFGQLKSTFHRRLIFEEFFWLELFLATRKAGLVKESAAAMKKDFTLVESLLGRLPFELTGAQKRVLKEIFEDLLKPHPMHRLVQGDVGSGKTAVALLAAAFVASSGYQSALMVPTEILSEQHYLNAKKLLEPLGLRIGLLTGHLGAKQKREVLEKLENHEIDLCVGTHALIQADVNFAKLGFVIVDEQHRFGVHQRQELKHKGQSPHFLVMTATPIPRTLAMTVYGDLDVSVIDELPKGRQPIVTRVVYENKRAQVQGFVRDQVAKGRQAYVVYPLVEESEKMDLKDAMSAFESWQKILPEVKFGLLHGRMKAAEKEEIMQQFRRGEIQVLVSTTVIEVGVDVANANLMIIEHSERFGLSQLHQLRGRVGRGEHKSYCVLMMGKAISTESKERAQIMAESSDGFRIAEADLEIRGPGEFLGARQSGLPGFKMANLIRDIAVLQDARQAAFELVNRDRTLSKAEHKTIKEELLKKHGATALATVG
jgi:ATP-dependent DNA helicase RecG